MDIKKCAHWLMELKESAQFKIERRSFVRAVMPQFLSARRALNQGDPEPLFNLLKSWADSNADRKWILEFPIDWVQLIQDIHVQVDQLKPTALTTPAGKQSPYERAQIFQAHTLALIMKMFRDGQFSSTPDKFGIQENWITWGMKQPTIVPHDDLPRSIIARRAQQAFHYSFADQFVPSKDLYEEVEDLRRNLQFLSPGSIAFMARDLKRRSQDPEDIAFADHALKISEKAALKYVQAHELLSVIERRLQEAQANDRAYAPGKIYDLVVSLDESVNDLIALVSLQYRALQDRILIVEGVPVEFETPQGEKFWESMSSRIKNAQTAHQVGLILAAKHGDTTKLKELLSQNLIPADQVRDQRGLDLIDISARHPEAQKLLREFFGDQPR